MSLNVLILSKDPTFFAEEPRTSGDTGSRHKLYAQELERQHPGSTVRVITYTPRIVSESQRTLSTSLQVFGTRSIHRATYLLGVARALSHVLRDGWRPDVVTPQ